MERPARKFIGLRIDIETRSATEIKFGSYRYAEDPEFAVLIISYCPIYRYAGGATKLGKVRRADVWDRTSDFARVIQDPRFQKHAFNANFERIALSKWLGMANGTYLDPANWHCTAVRANVNGVFGSLDEVGRHLRAAVRKDTEGKRLIRLFSKPDKKTGRFHDLRHRTESGFVVPGCWCGADHRADFEKFEVYCDRDVVAEAMVAGSLPDIPPHVQHEYEFDQRINDRGVRHFKTLALRAVEQVEIERDRLMTELKTLTGIDNPNSIPQFKAWLDEQDYYMSSLDKAHRAEALDDPLIPPHVARALEMKGAASLSSVTKHKAALNSRCADGRIRGMLGFYGAHTGREAGRVMQPQNLPRYEAPPIDRKRMLMGKAGPDAPTIAKGVIRASLVPARDHVFVVVDENAIEARVLAGLAGERWAQAEFKADGKIYEATASNMFSVDKAWLLAGLKVCDKCGKDTCAFCALRSKGKVSNLALGYAGGAGALVTMGAEAAGIDIGNYRELHREWKEDGAPGKFHEWRRDEHDYPELLRLRDLYRDSSPATTRFWKLCARAWDVAATGKAVAFGDGQVLSMMRDGKHNRLVLPSGRSIWYRFAQSRYSDTDPDRVERRTFIGKGLGAGHIRVDTHGGKLTENVTQAVARDVLFDVMDKIETMTAKGWPGRLVLHVHDEVVLEVPKRQADQVLADTIGLMAEPPEWGKFLVVKGEGKIMERYGK
jgi:DNA polymerase